MSEQPLLVASGLGRRFRALTALAGVDLTLRRGEALALLGPNGAGKTTLLSILADLAGRHEGQLEWRADVERIGWVPQRPALYGRLTARENLELFAKLERRPEPTAVAAKLIERADLAEFADRRAATLSTGTLARLNMCVALAGAPRVLLLDEPTATLSPDQRRRIWSWLGSLQEDDGLALVFSTQLVGEAVAAADRLLILADGEPVFAGTGEELTARAPDTAVADAAEQAFLDLVDAE